MKHIAVFGATSAIATATARLWAAEGHRLFLVARNEQALDRLRADLEVRGASAVTVRVADLSDLDAHDALIREAAEALGGMDIALLAHGVLGDQHASEQDFETALGEITINALSPLSLLTILANTFEAQGRGTIVALSSVAGDRGRASNYVYGAAKAALSTFMQGLGQRLQPAGVDVLTVKPGFVDTPMTEAFDKNFLWASPEQVAASIVRATVRGRSVLYTPWFWRFIMAAVRAVPEPIFRRLKL